MVGVDGSVAGVDGLGRASAGSFASRAASCWSLCETAPRDREAIHEQLLPILTDFLPIFTDFSRLSWDNPTMRLRVRLLVRPSEKVGEGRGGVEKVENNLEEVGNSRRKFETVLGPSRNKHEQIRKR